MLSLFLPLTAVTGTIPLAELQINSSVTSQSISDSIGEVANENYKILCHLVLKLDSAEEAALPGDVSCSYSKIPDIVVGDTINIY